MIVQRFGTIPLM
uniref:Uncharacterized protein n=1 Tax=Anguilla anguilla TaxID=7936 RepID=A0A0E9U659_ANGAN